jgi:hypothetical protein
MVYVNKVAYCTGIQCAYNEIELMILSYRQVLDDWSIFFTGLTSYSRDRKKQSMIYSVQQGEIIHLLRQGDCPRWVWRGLIRSLIIIALFSSIACSSNALQKSSLPASAQALPGLQIWKQGVSSFLFGANDTQEWSTNNVETSPAIQEALTDAHFSLMRTFFFDKSLALYPVSMQMKWKYQQSSNV